MVIALGDKPGESKVVATDANNQLLTHVERLDHLFQNGFQFEAAVSQMAVVEALLLFYLKSRIQPDKLTVKEDLKKLLKRKKLTFGKVKSIVIGNKILHDEAVQSDLVAYVGYRNDFAHNLISTFSSVDLQQFYAIGQRLVEFFHTYLLQIVKRHVG